MTDQHRLKGVYAWLAGMVPISVACIGAGVPEMAIAMLRAAAEMLEAEFVHLADAEELDQLRAKLLQNLEVVEAQLKRSN